jgi:hypothetical protein
MIQHSEDTLAIPERSPPPESYPLIRDAVEVLRVGGEEHASLTRLQIQKAD